MSAKPEISKKWWSSEKPADIKGQTLEKALVVAEKALADADKKGDTESVDACLAALESLGKAADTTIKKECDKKKHKEVIALLEKYEDVIDKEVERLEKLKGTLSKESDKDKEKEKGDDEDEKGILKPEYLIRMIKLLRGGEELNFCFGLNKSAPADSRLLLCNKRKPDRLHKILKGTGDFSNRLMTFGHATGDGKTIQFVLAEDSKEPSQIVKLAKQFLKGNRDLKFRKIRVLSGGEAFEDDMEADGASGDLREELARIQNLVTEWKKTLQSVSAQVDELRRALEGQADPALRKVHEALGTVMDQFPDLDLAQLVHAASSNDRGAYDQALTLSAGEIRDVQDLLANGPLLSTIDENPFVKTNVHKTVNAALQHIVTELSVTA